MLRTQMTAALLLLHRGRSASRGGIEARVLKKAVDQSEQVLVTVLEAMEIPQLGLVQRSVHSALEQLGVAEHRLKRSAEVMTENRQQLGTDSIFLGPFRAGARQIFARDPQLVERLGEREPACRAGVARNVSR